MEMLKQALLKLSKNSGVQLSLLALLGGLIFVVFFYWTYSNMGTSFYHVHDDGIITMSHAKNLVDYGFIGVNPSGDRVEGYSAPVQFFVYAAAYGLTGIGYETYAHVQTALFTFLLGALFILFFKGNRARAVALSVLAAFILSTQMRFLQWHGSGMENPITHVLFFATLLILYSFAKDEKINYPIAYLWAAIVFLAAISRLESVYHIAPLLAIFSGFWLFRFKNLSGFYFSFLVFILWFTYHLWRYIYFGDLLPNTAYAQNISIDDRLLNWISWQQWYINQSIGWSNKIFFAHGGYLLLAVTPLLFFVRRQKAVLLFFLLIGSLVLTAYFHPFVFGKARLGLERTTTHLALVAALGITATFYFMEYKKYIRWIPASLLAGLSAISNVVEPYRVSDFFARRQKAVLLFFLLIGSLALAAYFHPFVFSQTSFALAKPITHLALFVALGITAIFYFIAHKKYILWIAPASLLIGLLAVSNVVVSDKMSGLFLTLRQDFTKIAETESLPRLTIATSALGVLSWYKEFNVVDIGWLGTPIMAKLREGPIVADYFFDYAAPDMLETRVGWFCHHKISIFEDPRFREMYATLKEKFKKKSRWCGEKLHSGQWVRKNIQRGAKTKERILIDDLKTDPSVDRLRQELNDCQSDPQRNCVYVARTAFRFLPEFRDKEKIDALNEVFLTSRTKDYDLYLINGYKDGQAHVSALEYIASQYINKVQQSNRPVIQSNYDVYIHNNHLVYVWNACKKEDIKFKFLVRVMPKNKEDLPSGKNRQNLDFNFKSVRGMEFKGKCIAMRKLPDYDIRSIRTGQVSHKTGQKTWNATYPFSK